MAGKAKTAVRPGSPGERRRRAIIDAAHSLFITKGYTSVSVDDIVAVAGGSKASVYKFFGNKEGVLAAVTRDLADRMLVEIEMPQAGTGKLRDNLRRIGLTIGRMALSDSAIKQHRLAVANHAVDPVLSDLWFEHGPGVVFACVAEYLRGEAAVGRLRIRDCTLAAHFLLGMIVFKDNMTMLVGAPRPTEAELRGLVHEAVDVFLAAYGA